MIFLGRNSNSFISDASVFFSMKAPNETNKSLIANDIADRHADAPSPSLPACATAVLSGGAVTTIAVKSDVGFGNAVFLRGSGCGLNWEHGVPLTCLDGKTWHWSGMIKSPLSFKVLINDRIWSTGSDLMVVPGQMLEVNPTFA